MLDDQITRAVEVLKQGGVIAYPTEAVFGLGCDPRDESALRRILDIKQREAEKGLILIAATYEQLRPYLQPLDTETENRILASWPGAVTWIVAARDEVSTSLKGKHDSLAVRVTDHPMVIELCNRFGGAIVSTSANPAGKPPARTASQVKDYFNESLDFIVDAPTGGRDRPSEIRDSRSQAVIRPA